MELANAVYVESQDPASDSTGKEALNGKEETLTTKKHEGKASDTEKFGSTKKQEIVIVPESAPSAGAIGPLTKSPSSKKKKKKKKGPSLTIYEGEAIVQAQLVDEQPATAPVQMIPQVQGVSEQPMHANRQMMPQQCGSVPNHVPQQSGNYENQMMPQQFGSVSNQMMPNQSGSVSNQMMPQQPSFGQNQVMPQQPGFGQNQMTPQQPGFGQNQMAPQQPGFGQNQMMQQQPGISPNQMTSQDRGGGIMFSTPIVINNSANSNQASAVNNTSSGRDVVYVKRIGPQTWALCWSISMVTCLFTCFPCGIFAFLCPCDEVPVYVRDGKVYDNNSGACVGNAANMNIQNGPTDGKK